jgi:DhnA family fructose-bisphosphate aldolase class Ia
VELALRLGVDIVVGTWRPQSAAVIGSVKRSMYFPFLGSLSGSPLRLRGSPADLRAQMGELAENSGVAGVVLMPYRQKEHSPDELMPSVVRAADLPVLIAGGVGSSEQIMAIGRAGAWGFTMGAEALRRRHEDAGSVRRKVVEILSLCQSLDSASVGYGTRAVC